ncbi:HAD superfamily hydrolase [Grosmannia clavigera kw1407]|uniref:HAD superfamily hydrolase n=1 Tax=Grosmannia clavigera (strain kw1407 / UAMH 11150) TaxID=655863 RepID=F0XGQ2_GROCL|nr:HAD superfamily hydrolase [Grosmannia clavigera kw1407]EFX03137.1 HAD superfamily hydrolase [Grosmannia clavigera kw1407]
MAAQTSPAAASRRLFAPLKGYTAQGRPSAPAPAPGQQKHRPRVLKGVVFDVDGTLCIPQNYMFGEMRAVLGIDKSIDILDHIYSLPTEDQQKEAMERVRVVERRAMALQQAQPGLPELMAYLDSRGIPKAICTRNFEQPVKHLLGKFLDGHTFEPIVTRDFRPPKPDPAGILHIARSWGLTRSGAAEDAASRVSDEDTVDPAVLLAEKKEEAIEQAASASAPTAAVLEADASSLIMVGDSIDDMTAGRRAGAATVLLVNDVNRHLAEHAHTDMVIARLDDLIDVLEKGFVGREMSHLES